MTRTPITPDEIRKGDLIRAEKADERPGVVRAAEYVAEKDGQEWWSGAKNYLLDRPTPPVELPKEPTLGWLTWRADAAVCDTSDLGNWRTFKSDTFIACDDASVPQRLVTAFTPATAVPTEALGELRDMHNCLNASHLDLAKSVKSFLAAVDSANGTPS